VNSQLISEKNSSENIENVSR